MASNTTSTTNRLAAIHSAKFEMSGLARYIKPLQPMRAVAFRHGVRNVGDRLRRLTDRTGRNQFVGCGVDRGYAIGKYKISFAPALTLVQTGNSEADAVSNTALFTQAIESCVREHPEQWLWVHRRWR